MSLALTKTINPDLEQKQRFASLMSEPDFDPLAAALSIFPDDTKFAVKIAEEWPKDPEVKRLKIVNGEDSVDKDQLASQYAMETISIADKASNSNLNLARFQVETRKWLAERLDPSRWALKQQIDLNANVSHKVVSDDVIEDWLSGKRENIIDVTPESKQVENQSDKIKIDKEAIRQNALAR